MEELPILRHWMNYLNAKPEIVLSNCVQILQELERRYSSIQLVGRGYSGNYLVSALQMLNEVRSQHQGRRLRISSVIMRKVETGTSMTTVFTYDPIVVIDDDIYSGNNIEQISNQLGWSRAGGDLPFLVDAVVMICNQMMRIDENRDSIKKVFPNVKLWIR